jgi:hypothetical protein
MPVARRAEGCREMCSKDRMRWRSLRGRIDEEDLDSELGSMSACKRDVSTLWPLSSSIVSVKSVLAMCWNS